MTVRDTCLACGGRDLEVFHEQKGIPVSSCILLDDRSEALAFPTGDLRLAWCAGCGFITNQAFEPELTTYSERYEETQGFSPRFRAFAESLAARWVERHGLRGKHIVEIGCGKGEFLALICAAGDNRGTGFDPAFVAGRVASDDERLRFVVDRWSPAAYPDLAADAIVCRHTLEHIDQVGRFVGDVRSILAATDETVVLFEVPDVLRVLEEPAFWDLYYEHCSYFSPGSLARLFRGHGFAITDLSLDFDDQYIVLAATPASPAGTAHPGPTPDGAHRLECDLHRLESAVDAFPGRLDAHTDQLRELVEQASRRGEPVVVWGAGSKAVSFLCTLELGGQVRSAVDVNPHKRGRYLAGTGHRIVAPEDLVADPPGTVFVMNAVYVDEIRQMLHALDLHPTLVAV